MEKKQSDLCFEIIRRFHKSGILDDFILIGSWCLYFYKDYFSEISSSIHMMIKTRDIDFLINKPARIKQSVNIPELLRDLGFVTIFSGHEGYLKFDHPDLMLEFLVPEKGRGTDKPYFLSKLGINAVPLRFLNFLSANTIKIKIDDFYLTLPHPINFALHKFIISQRRIKKDKAAKDRDAAIEILEALIDKGESRMIRDVFNLVPQTWQRKIIKGLGDAIKEKKIAEVFKKNI